jgi:hypothetical protein
MNQSVYDQLREIEDKYVKVTEIETGEISFYKLGKKPIASNPNSLTYCLLQNGRVVSWCGFLRPNLVAVTNGRRYQIISKYKYDEQRKYNA